MAMAGLRAGYLLGDPAVVEQVNKAKLPYNINFYTEFAAAEVLRSRDLLAPGVAAIRSERDRMYETMERLPGLRVFPSAANFILFRVERPGLAHTMVFQRLLDEDGVLVRDVSKYSQLERCLRVNAGSPEENDAFLAGLTRILEEPAP